jgi:imidazolonepropionase-like amidohydrolase
MSTIIVVDRLLGTDLRHPYLCAAWAVSRKFEIDSQLGTIGPGKIASLVLLKKSPQESVDAYDSVVTIWVHGEPFSAPV